MGHLGSQGSSRSGFRSELLTQNIHLWPKSGAFLFIFKVGEGKPKIKGKVRGKKSLKNFLQHA